MGGASRIAGSTILIVEDDLLIGLDIAFLLEDEGARVMGPFRTSPDALRAVGERGPDLAIDCAVLDYDLAVGTSEPIAMALLAEGVPLVLYTGGSAGASDLARRTGAAVVEKPSRPGFLLEAIATALSGAFRTTASR